MGILADENIPLSLVREIRRRGVEIVSLIEEEKRGITDEEVVEEANSRSMHILTRDSDFLNPSILKSAKLGVIYLAYVPRREEIGETAEEIIRGLKRGEKVVIIAR